MSHRPASRGLGSFGVWALGCVFLGCASQTERGLRESLAARASVREASGDDPVSSTPAGEPPRTRSAAGPEGVAASTGRSKGPRRSGDVQSYVARAMEESPALKSAFERWRANVSRVSRGRRLPDPVLSFGVFVSSVETRVGPQRARLGLSQTFPWPTRLTASADAASATARASESQFDALALRIRFQVVSSYYQLWLVRELRKIHTEHLDVVRSLSETILARLETGSASLAEQQQVDLSAARLEDLLAGLDQDEAAALAQLRAVIGEREVRALPTAPAVLEARLPAESEESLASAATQHPFLEVYDYQAIAHEQTARALSAEGLPSFSLGADWIITDPALAAGVADSGKDALIVGGGISLPLWQGSYRDGAEAARADAAASRAERLSQEDRALAELRTALSEVRDAVRRERLYHTTLIPQAESAYASVLGSYVAGRGTVAQALLSQRDLLELREGLARAHADYAIAWARLEQVVGRSVVGSGVVGESATEGGTK